MKYVLAKGKGYAQYRGYVFWDDRPVDVTDRGTLELIGREPDFKEWKDEPQKVQAPAAPIQKRPVLTLGKRK